MSTLVTIMKPGIRTKLVIVLLMANGLLAGLMFWLSTTSINRGFLDYINQVEVQKLEPLVADLVVYHDRYRGWQWVNLDRRRLWRTLIQQHLMEHHPGKWRDQLQPAPSDAEHNGLLFDPRLLLKDSTGRLIIAPRHNTEEIQWIPIESEGARLGELGLIPRSHLSNRLEQLFAFQQQKHQAIIIAAAVIIALSLALGLALYFLRPIRELSNGVHQLADGKLETQISVSSTDELGQLADDINQLARVLRDNRDARQQWIADISHELRTPVTILQGEIEALMDGLREANPDNLASLQQETRRLGLLIEDLNELAMSDRGAINYHFSSEDIQLVLTDFVNAHQKALAEAGLSLDYQSNGQPVPCPIDRQRFEQLLGNLLQNTQRYTDTPGKLSISLQRDSDHAVIHWQDSSPGVSEQDLPRLFERLFRGERSRNRATGGAGLGLAICQNIVQAHDGTIAAYHSCLGGLGISIRLPLTIVRGAS